MVQLAGGTYRFMPRKSLFYIAKHSVAEPSRRKYTLHINLEHRRLSYCSKYLIYIIKNIYFLPAKTYSNTYPAILQNETPPVTK